MSDQQSTEKIYGFLRHPRGAAQRQSPTLRLRTYQEFEETLSAEELYTQSTRCMDCGVPFCNTGCPLGNLIPDWNNEVYLKDMDAAIRALHQTNNFPEITGRICPAPCEAACVLGINAEPVSIKLIERAIAEREFELGGWRPEPSAAPSGKRVAIVGSGPAGLAAAQQLARVGHEVTVFERDEQLGGLLMFGIPDFKLDKQLVLRRVEQMRAEGVIFRTGINVGEDISAEFLRAEFDAICLCGGAKLARDLSLPGRELLGVHFAMDYLTQQNRRVSGLPIHSAEIVATGKKVVVLGGGDTGSDCVGTALRQSAQSVVSFELMPRPPKQLPGFGAWPHWPLIFRTSTSHDEGGEREFSVMTLGLEGDAGRLTHLRCARTELQGGTVRSIPGSEFRVEADLLFLAMGFVGPEPSRLLRDLGLKLSERGQVQVDAQLMSSVPGVFSAGDMQRGQSLVVWAIADGRRAAKHIDTYLRGATQLKDAGSAGQLR